MEHAIFAGQISPSRARAAAELDDIDALWTAYRGRIYRYVLLSLRDPDLAESITEDCFLKAHAARRDFRGDCSAATWLTRIATNLIRDTARSRKFQFWRAAEASAVDAHEIADRLRSPGLTPEADLQVRQQLAGVWAAVETLSAKQRSVFLLRFVEEMELAEIAETLEMNLGTVKSHLHRALHTVRSKMGRQA